MELQSSITPGEAARVILPDDLMDIKKKSFRRILALKLIRASALKVSEHLKDLNARGSNDRGLIKQDSKYLAQQE